MTLFQMIFFLQKYFCETSAKRNLSISKPTYRSVNPDFGFINKIGFEAPQRRVPTAEGKPQFSEKSPA
jgi:hypothetical protein